MPLVLVPLSLCSWDALAGAWVWCVAMWYSYILKKWSIQLNTHERHRCRWLRCRAPNVRGQRTWRAYQPGEPARAWVWTRPKHEPLTPSSCVLPCHRLPLERPSHLGVVMRMEKRREMKREGGGEESAWHMGPTYRINKKWFPNNQKSRFTLSLKDGDTLYLVVWLRGGVIQLAARYEERKIDLLPFFFLHVRKIKI